MAPAAIAPHRDSASYASSGFGNRMGWGERPVLVLIDVCKAYWTSGSPLDLSAYPQAANVPDSISRLVHAAREGGCPVVWTAVEYTSPDMCDAGLFWKKAKALECFQRGSELHMDGMGDWMPGLEPAERDIVIKKKYPSGFFGTTLATDLVVKGIDTVVIGGVSTSGCVRASALDAMQYGFRPMVVADACGDRSSEIQQANLFDLDSKYADVVSEEEAVQRLKMGWKA